METDIFEGMEQQQREFFELMMKKEPLHPDLAAYLERNPKIGMVLKHPMVIELFYSEQSNARLNKQYEQKKQWVAEKLGQKNWSGAIWMYERPYRMQQFIEWKDDMTGEEYWELLGDIWSDSENLWQYGPMLGLLLKDRRPGRHKMMNDKEQAFLDGLPETFTVYRGHQGKRNRYGWSWSLSYGKAKWFAHRFGQKGAAVLRATAKKADVYAYLGGRNEFEIVADPGRLKDFKLVRPAKRKPWVQALADEALAGFQLSQSRSLHGPDHWEKVEKNGLALAKRTPEADARVVQLFALLHDSQRQDEDDDPGHGQRAADYVIQLFNKDKLPITIVQKELLAYACRFHNDGKTSDNPTIGVCWDADRLDLTRVGISPEDKYLSTKAGKELKWLL